MIHNDVQNQLQLLIKTSAPPLIEVGEHATSTPQWTPGQRLPAHVLASLPNGRFDVRVGDQVLDLNLPRNTQAGDNLELTFVGDKPRLTFALSQDLANLAPARTPVSLSETARFIGSLLQKGAPDAAETAQSARTTPVVNSLPADTASFAQSLRQALSQSGLFYESHQAQWVGGQRSLATLLQEPQGRLSPLLAQAQPAANAAHSPTAPQAAASARSGASPADASAAPSASSAPTAPAGGPALSSANAPGKLEIMAEAGKSSAAALGGARPADEMVHPQSTPLVQQQLQVLDGRQLLWQGQVWPGQDMRWEIEEDGARSGGESEQESASWQTRLSLQLPVMGGVSARISLTQGAVQLDIAAEQGESVETMRSRQEQLLDGFREAGLVLAGVSIHRDAPE